MGGGAQTRSGGAHGGVRGSERLRAVDRPRPLGGTGDTGRRAPALAACRFAPCGRARAGGTVGECRSLAPLSTSGPEGAGDRGVAPGRCGRGGSGPSDRGQLGPRDAGHHAAAHSRAPARRRFQARGRGTRSRGAASGERFPRLVVERQHDRASGPSHRAHTRRPARPCLDHRGGW